MFECALDRDLPKATLFMIANAMVIERSLSVAGVDTVGKLNVGVFQQCDRRDQVERGSRLEQATRCKVEFLVKAAASVGRKIRYGLDMTRVDFHDHHETVVGVVSFHRVVQRGLRYILQVDVEGGNEIETIDGPDIIRVKNRLPNAAGDFLIVGIPISSGQLLVKTVFQARTFIVFIDEADRTPAELAERVVAYIDFFEDDTAAKPAFSEYRPGRHRFFVLVIDTLLVEDNVLPSRSAGIAKHALVFILGFIAKESGQTSGQRIQSTVKEFV